MENHGDIRRDRKTSRWDVFASRWKGNGNSSILRKPSSTVGDISRKIAVLPCAGWDLKNFKDIPKTNWRWGVFNQKRSRTNKKSGSTRSKWFESMWVCKWNFRNSEARETALQYLAMQPSLCASSFRHFTLRSSAEQTWGANMQSASIWDEVDSWDWMHQGTFILVYWWRWYSLILETFDICPIAKLKWIYTDCNVLTCTSLAMPSRCFAGWRSGIGRYPGRALHSPSFVGCPSRSRLRCHPPSATRHPWRWNEFHLCFCVVASASISLSVTSVTWGCLASPLLQVRPTSSRQSDDHCDWDPHGLCRLDGFKASN